jgi:hypothetical protein
MRLRRGRFLHADDARRRAPVAVVTAALVRRYWPDGEALGASLERVHPELAGIAIVGIADDVNSSVRQTGAPPIVHLPLIDSREAEHIVIRARGDAATAALPVRTALEPLGVGGVDRVRTVREEIDRALGPVRMVASVASIFAVFTLALAALGLVGVTTFVVQQRAREIGVRLALGATRERVVALFVRQSLLPVVVGLGVGLAAALATSGLIASILWGVGPRDPLAIGSAVAILVTVSSCAVIIPAGHASRLDPAVVLRD